MVSLPGPDIRTAIGRLLWSWNIGALASLAACLIILQPKLELDVTRCRLRGGRPGTTSMLFQPSL